MAIEIFYGDASLNEGGFPTFVSGGATTDATAQPTFSGTSSLVARVTRVSGDAVSTFPLYGWVNLTGATLKQSVYQTAKSATYIDISGPDFGIAETVSAVAMVRLPMQFQAKKFIWHDHTNGFTYEWNSGLPLNSCIRTTWAGVRLLRGQRGYGDGSGQGIIVLPKAIYLAPTIAPVSSSFSWEAQG